MGNMDSINYQSFIHASYPSLCCDRGLDPFIFVCKKMDTNYKNNDNDYNTPDKDSFMMDMPKPDDLYNINYF